MAASRAATASESAPETVRSVSVEIGAALAGQRRADLVHLREQPVVGRGDRVALADGVLQPLAHQVERGRELAALLDRLQDRGLLPADLLHRDLEALLRRAGLGGALVALGGELVEPGLLRLAGPPRRAGCRRLAPM